MNRSEFFLSLANALQGMPEQDKQDALSYFDELISDKAQDSGCSEEEAIASLGPIGEIASSIRQTQTPAASQTAGQAPAQDEPQDEDQGAYSIKTITAQAASVRSVVIETANVPIDMAPGGDEKIILEYTQDAFDVYDFSLENGALRLIRRPVKPMNMFGFMFRYRRPARIKLTVPAEFAATCSLTSENSVISARDISFWSWLTCRTSNGPIRLERLKAQGDLTAKSSNSGCTLESLRVKGSLQVTTSNSPLKSQDIQAESITLITSNAPQSARHLTARGPILLETRNGRLDADNIKSSAQLTLRTSNARLTLKELMSPDIRLISSNGKVEGSIRGAAREYSVTSRTSNGQNNLSNHLGHGPKHLDVKTSNANIQLEFLEQTPG